MTITCIHKIKPLMNCKECRKERNRELCRKYHKEHKVESRKYYQDHKEQSRTYGRRYYERHKEQCKERSVIWKQEHQEQVKKYRQKQREHRKELLRKRKEKYVHMLGNKCVKCGYDKCFSALDFHHLDNSKEEKTESKTRKFEQKIKDGKIQLLCSNCHREITYEKRLKTP